LYVAFTDTAKGHDTLADIVGTHNTETNSQPTATAVGVQH